MDFFNLYYIKNYYLGLEGEFGNSVIFTIVLGFIIWSVISEWIFYEMEFVWFCVN